MAQVKAHQRHLMSGKIAQVRGYTNAKRSKTYIDFMLKEAGIANDVTVKADGNKFLVFLNRKVPNVQGIPIRLKLTEIPANQVQQKWRYTQIKESVAKEHALLTNKSITSEVNMNTDSILTKYPLLEKSRVKAHQRKTKTGKIAQVREYTDSRTKKVKEYVKQFDDGKTKKPKKFYHAGTITSIKDPENYYIFEDKVLAELKKPENKVTGSNPPSLVYHHRDAIISVHNEGKFTAKQVAGWISRRINKKDPPSNINKSILDNYPLLQKAQIKAHTRRTKGGKVVQVREHRDTRKEKIPFQLMMDRGTFANALMSALKTKLDTTEAYARKIIKDHDKDLQAKWKQFENSGSKDWKAAYYKMVVDTANELIKKEIEYRDTPARDEYKKRFKDSGKPAGVIFIDGNTLWSSWSSGSGITKQLNNLKYLTDKKGDSNFDGTMVADIKKWAGHNTPIKKNEKVALFEIPNYKTSLQTNGETKDLSVYGGGTKPLKNTYMAVASDKITVVNFFKKKGEALAWMNQSFNKSILDNYPLLQKAIAPDMEKSIKFPTSGSKLFEAMQFQIVRCKAELAIIEIANPQVPIYENNGAEVKTDEDSSVPIGTAEPKKPIEPKIIGFKDSYVVRNKKGQLEWLEIILRNLDIKKTYELDKYELKQYGL